MISADAIRTATQIAPGVTCFLLVGISFHELVSRLHGQHRRTLVGDLGDRRVLQATRRATWSSASLRVLGTVIGSIISATYLALLPFSPLGLAVAMFATVLLCHAARIPDHARLASITVAVIMVTASLNPTLDPIQNAALRLSESCIGTVMAVLAVLVWPGPNEPLNPPPPGKTR